MIDQDWCFSHTQLSLFRLCPRRYDYKYVLGLEEPKTAAMGFGTLTHDGIEASIQDVEPNWDLYWANYLAEIGETDTFDDPLYNLKTAKRCLDLYKKSPIPGKITAVEEKAVYTFPDGTKFGSKADFVVERAPTVYSIPETFK